MKFFLSIYYFYFYFLLSHFKFINSLYNNKKLHNNLLYSLKHTIDPYKPTPKISNSQSNVLYVINLLMNRILILCKTTATWVGYMTY